MTKFASILGSTVTNIIIADTKEIAEEATKSFCVELSSAENWVARHTLYDEVTKKFIQPTIGEPDA